MKNKLLFIIKLVSLAFFSFLWFVLIQPEYEMITKPELQNEFPIIKGVYAVYFLGFILLIISVIIVSLLPLLINLIKSMFYKNMKKILIGLIAVVLFLDWAALHDITEGREPDLRREYLMIILSVPVLLFIGFLLYSNRQKKHELKP